MQRVLIAVPILVLLVASFVLGARYGAEAFVQAEAKHRAELATLRLEAIDSSNIEQLRNMAEGELGVALLLHARGQDNSLAFLYPEVADSDNSSLKHASTYRKNHPVEPLSQAELERLPEAERLRYLEGERLVDALVQQHAQ